MTTPGRVLAFDAAIRVAERKVGGSAWRERFQTPAVIAELDEDVNERTVRRACRDAADLGWLEKTGQHWKPGERARTLAAGGGIENTTDL